jgi:predicted membrane protein
MLKIISNIKRTPILLSIGLVLGMGVVSRCQITSAVNGDYSVGATWVGGSSPDALLDNVLILHDVTMDSDITIEQNFQIQGSLIGTAGNDITVSGIGTLEAGLIDINGNISLSNDGSMTIYSGDTVTVNDFWMQNNSVLTVEAGAVLIVNGDFTGKNNGIVTLDGEICVSGATKITNNFMVIGSGYFKTGSSTTIKNGATIFGSSTECTDCIYSSGCTSGAISEWDGSSGTDWFTAANWSNGVPNDQTPARIPSTASAMPVINAAGAECFHLMVLPGASVEIAASNSLDVYGDLVMRGSFIPNQSTVNMVGTCASGRLNSGGNTNLHSLLVNNINDVAITAGTWGITGSLDVVLGSFDTNDSLTIISNSLGTGRIGEILGVGITGEISMERYIDAGETNWRYFSSAVTGATLAQYNDDFVTAGYPGSWYPAFGWESIYTYDETMGVGFGYLPATSSAQVIGVGQGLQVWCGDTITGTLPFTVDLRGVPNQGPILMPVSYTFTGTPGEDGFCHIGNPYASTIDWDAIGWVKVNVAEATYIVDPDTEMYATYIAGAGTNGGSRYIASQQAFWVEATAVAPVLSITESCKSGTDATFFKSGIWKDSECLTNVSFEIRKGQSMPVSRIGMEENYGEPGV